MEDYKDWVWVNPPQSWDKLDENLREIADHQKKKDSLLKDVKFVNLKQEIK